LLNSLWQELLARAASESAWSNYRLIGTQWFITDETVNYDQLANITLETYNQPVSSCVGCHNAATTAVGKNANFSFLLNLAKRPTGN
ncbi:MAG: hypothetical protein AAFY11_13020, partial [Cyanobacteria bacterium J06641_5]